MKKQNSRSIFAFTSRAVVLATVVAVAAMPDMAVAGSEKGGAVLRLPPVNICADAQGKPRPVFKCANNGPANQSTLPETEKIIADRLQVNICHARAQGSPSYTPTVGWGTYIDTPEELQAGKCPKADAMQSWFRRDLSAAYARGQAQAQALGNNSACMTRTLAAINHQVGDLRRKYPDTWKKMQSGRVCEVAVEMLEWSWYQQSCDRTLDTVLALGDMAQCKVSR